MGHYITPDGNYYNGEYVAEGSIEVTERPSPDHIWVDGGWVVNFPAQKAAELAAFRVKREAYLNRVAGIGFAARESGDVITAAATVAVRQALLDLPAHPAVTAATDIDSLKMAVIARYAAIVNSLPAEAKAAFKKVDQ